MDKDDDISFDGGDPLADVINQKQDEGKLIKNGERPDLDDNERDWTNEKEKRKKEGNKRT